jgi:hypothetical protein
MGTEVAQAAVNACERNVFMDEPIDLCVGDDMDGFGASSPSDDSGSIVCGDGGFLSSFDEYEEEPALALV